MTDVNIISFWLWVGQPFSDFLPCVPHKLKIGRVACRDNNLGDVGCSICAFTMFGFDFSLLCLGEIRYALFEDPAEIEVVFA